MKRAFGSFGSSGEASKVRQHVRRGRGRVSAARDRDCKMERKHVTDGRLDMPTKEQFAESLRDGFCWWCGRTHTKEGKEISSWSIHFVKAHSLDLQELRDILEVPKTHGFVTDDLHARLAERSRKQLAANPDHLKSLREGARKSKRRRSFSKYGCKIQREKSLRTFNKSPGMGREHMIRIARIRAKKQMMKREPIECAACGVLFSPLVLKGKQTRTTCSDDCASEMKRRATAAHMKPKRKQIVCSGCGKKFWRRGQPATCSKRCAKDVQIKTGKQTSYKARGERSSGAKLTKERVLEIRQRYARGDVSQSALAERYGILQSSVSSIVLGKSWAHVGGPIAKPKDLSECGQRSRVCR